MSKKQILFFLILALTYTLNAQEKKKGILNIKKVGFLYNNVNAKNFIFEDEDYKYTSNTIKLQAFYNLGKWRSFDFELMFS